VKLGAVLVAFACRLGVKRPTVGHEIWWRYHAAGRGTSPHRGATTQSNRRMSNKEPQNVEIRETLTTLAEQETKPAR
jgi:hypothetical protein